MLSLCQAFNWLKMNHLETLTDPQSNTHFF